MCAAKQPYILNHRLLVHGLVVVRSFNTVCQKSPA